MKDKTRDQLIAENEELRRRVAAMERRLQENQSAAALLQVAPLGIHECDTEGRITFVSPSQEAITGYRADELVGTYIWDRTEPGPARDALPAYLKHLVSEQPPPTPFLGKNIRKNGEVFDVRVDWNYKRDEQGQVTGFVSIVSDITDQVRAVEAVRESEARARGLMETVPLGIAECDTEGVITLANPAYEHMTGYSSEELLGMRVADLLQEGPQREGLLDYFRHLVLEQPTPTPYRCKDITKDGRLIDVQVDWAYKRNPQGQVTGFTSIISDITARKRAETELRAERNRAQQYLDVAGVIMVVLDKSCNIRLLNRKGYAVLGYDDGDLLGKNWFDTCVPQRIRDEVKSVFGQLIAGGEALTEHYDNPVLTKSGEERMIAWHNAILTDDTGAIVGTLSSGLDITERKRAEEALRESELRFRSLFQDSAVGTMLVTPNGDFLQANKAFCDFLGYSESELLSQTVQSVTHPEDREAASKARHQALTSGPRLHRFEKRYLHKNGQVLWGELTATLICDAQGKPSYCVAQVLDISERKRAEMALQQAYDELERRVEERTAALTKANEQLRREVEERRRAEEAVRESEEKYRTLVETSPDAVIMGDLTGHVTFASSRALQMYGTDNVGELLGRNPLDFFAPEDHQKFLTNLRRTLEEGVTKDVEYDLVRKDGTCLVGEASAAAVKDMTGKPKGFVTIIRDITERRQAQEALERERCALQHMLQASDHERQTISYDIHDGLAQYLAAAGMQFQGFDRLRESNPEEAKKAYDTAVELVRQAHFESRRLISEVRPPVIEESGLETAISHLVHEQRRRGGPKIECHSSVQFGRLPSILENALYRIAQEALTNACKHSNSKNVTVTLAQEGQEVRLEVRDWGIGFDPEAIQTGHFGLEGIRQRVRLLGGRLNIDSKPGSGTMVQAIVPIVEKQVVEQRQEE